MWKKRLALASLLLAIALFAWFLSSANLGDVWSQVRQARTDMLVGAFVCVGLTFWIRALRWQYLLKPIGPTRLPSHSAPQAWQASSITASLWRLATALMASMLTGQPPMWTGMIDLVRGVIAGSRSSARPTAPPWFSSTCSNPAATSPVR